MLAITGLYTGYIGVILGYIGGYIGAILRLYWGYIGTMENKMETAIWGVRGPVAHPGNNVGFEVRLRIPQLLESPGLESPGVCWEYP